MDWYTYLIIGGGMAADAAVKGIRQLDQTARIGIISQEEYPPYDRPPLTKGLWFGTKIEEICRKTEKEQISFHLGKKVVSINPDSHIVTDHIGNNYSYEKLLLATGGTPKKLPFHEEGLIYFRTLNDYYRLRDLYNKGEEFVVIGSGYLGTEIASALCMNGKKVTMIFREPSIGSKKFPKKFSKFMNSFFTEKGVRLLPTHSVTSISKKNGKYVVDTSAKERLYADGVVIGIGIEPNLELAKAMKLETNNGVVVDRYLESSRSGIFAAGDVANFFSPHLEKRVRIEHEDCANSTGFQAGRNITGAKEPYNYLPYFYSDLFELGFEAIGEISSTMEIVEDWHDLYRTGILYYLKEGKLKGAMLWGIRHKIEMIREMISSKQVFTADSLVGQITA